MVSSATAKPVEKRESSVKWIEKNLSLSENDQSLHKNLKSSNIMNLVNRKREVLPKQRATRKVLAAAIVWKVRRGLWQDLFFHLPIYPFLPPRTHDVTLRSSFVSPRDSTLTGLLHKTAIDVSTLSKVDHSSESS